MSSTEEKKKKSKSSRPRAAEQVVARNIAVSSIYRKLIAMALVSTLSATIAVVAAMSLAAKKVPPQFVPVLSDGRILPLIPLDKSNMSHAKIAGFSLDAIKALNTYDYINWQHQLNAAQQYFSPQGWKKYEEEMVASGTLKAVEARKMIVSIRPTGNAETTWEGKAPNGVYAWKVVIPVIIRYTAHVGNEQGNTQRGKISVVLSRVPTTTNAAGVAIQEYKLVEER